MTGKSLFIVRTSVNKVLEDDVNYLLVLPSKTQPKQLRLKETRVLYLLTYLSKKKEPVCVTFSYCLQ